MQDKKVLDERNLVHLKQSFDWLKNGMTWNRRRRSRLAVLIWSLSITNLSLSVKPMGGVDLADILLTLYRADIITRKRWYLKLIFHPIDKGKVNI